MVADLERPADLRRALRDPVAAFDSPAARGSYALRMELCERLGRALAAGGREALLVKGAGLALDVYPRPWLRAMSDVDLVVPAAERDATVRLLESAGCRVARPDERRPLSADAFDEVQLTAERGPVSLLVEVHTGLDKVVPRAIPYDEISARGRAAPDLPGFRIPGREDHALLVVLHAATSEFRHPVAFVDLELLLRAGLDLGVLETRARRFSLATACWVAFATLEALEAPSLPAGLVARLCPSRARRLALAAHYRVGRYPVARGTLRLGLPWALAQGALRDDLRPWLAGLGRYTALRLRERLAPRA